MLEHLRLRLSLRHLESTEESHYGRLEYYITLTVTATI